MKTFFQDNKLYCFCQLFGALFFHAVLLLLFLISGKPIEEINFAIIAKSYLLIIFISHFIIRNNVKLKAYNSQFNIKIYALSISIATIFYIIIDRLSDFIFSPFFDSKNTKKELSFLSELGGEFIFYLLLFFVWCILYVAITSIREKKILSQQLKEQQLASLMNQINPHFLFNSLNTIRGMIYEDQDKAAELVTQFSSLFRYNLSLERKKTTYLGEELTVCQQYLAIEAIRLGERLKIHIDVPTQHHHCKIPVMGLFTLVENAVKHGIAHLQQGGELSISASLQNDKLVIEVTNPYDKNLVKSGTQIGLKNLQKRTQILFSEQGNIMQNSDNDTFKVTLSIPYKVVENAE